MAIFRHLAEKMILAIDGQQTCQLCANFSNIHTDTALTPVADRSNYELQGSSLNYFES